MIAWAFFDVGLGIFSMVVLSRYAGPWIKDQLNGDVPLFNATISVSMAIAGILQIVLSPISDETGKRRIFVVCSTVLLIIGCFFLSKATTLWNALFILAGTNIAYQTGVVFYNSMLLDVSDERHRARVSGIGMALAYTGAVIGLLYVPRYVSHSDIAPAFAATAFLTLIFSLPLFFFVSEKKSLVRLNLASSIRNSIGAFLTTLRRITRNRQLLFFFLGALFAFDVVETIVVNMALYCKDVAGLSGTQGIEFPITYMGKTLFRTPVISQIDMFIIASVVFAILSSLIIGHISDKVGHYKTFVCILVLWMVALLMTMYAVHRKFWIIGPLFGIGFGGIRTVGRAYLSEICHPEERGQMFAIFGLIGRGAAVLGPLVWAGTFYLFEPMLNQRGAYRMSILSMLLLMVIGFWLILRGRPTEESSGRRFR